MSDGLRFRPGVEAEPIIQSLTQLVVEGRNLAASSGGRDIADLQNNYLQWVETVERSLRHYFASPIWEELHGRRWARIQSLDLNTWIARPFPLINQEAQAQADRLDAIVQQLERSQKQFKLPNRGCVVVVPDTSVLLHYRFFKDVDWLKLVDAKEVRLVIPLLVIEQLDRHSYKRQADEGRRARAVLRALEEIQQGLSPIEAPAVLKRRVTVQMLMDPSRHSRWPLATAECI